MLIKESVSHLIREIRHLFTSIYSLVYWVSPTFDKESKKPLHFRKGLIFSYHMVSEEGLEPSRLTAYAPQTYVSAHSTTPTLGLDRYIMIS